MTNKSFISCKLDLFPDYYLQVALLEKGSPKPLTGSKDYILVNAAVIPDVFFIASAASRALSSYQHDALVTKSLHEEVAFYLLPSNNVSFVLSELTNINAKYFFFIQLCKFDEAREQNLNFSLENVESNLGDGFEIVDLEKHKEILDSERISKLYSLAKGYEEHLHFDQCLNSLAIKKV
jgi:hypothetical protein